MSTSREYRSWASAKKRCQNPNDAHYYLYGGRGITMCAEWANSFEAFLRDLGHAPTQKHSIDRIDSNGNYEPGNCRWALAETQANNTRANRRITFCGETFTVAQWERRLGMPPGRIKSRLRSGWPVARALTEPVHR